MGSQKGSEEIASRVFWVGAKDRDRKLFDGLIQLPHGTSYNAYLIVGSEKVALIDTVYPGFEKQLLDNVSERIDPAKVDYVIMNHAEPDHSNAAKDVLAIAKKAKLVTGAKGKELAMIYFDIPADRIMVVDENSKVILGDKTLKFVDAPWLHWPETIFTYLEEDKILFPCDFFGSHLAVDQFYADEYGNEKTLDMARLYFAEIMMPFRKAGQAAIEKVKKLGPKMIAPSHGLIWRDPNVILDEYTDWTKPKFQKKAVIVYVSMYGSTEKMVLALADALKKRGVAFRMFELTTTEIGQIAKELVDTPVVVLGAPTVLGTAHPVAAYAAMLIKTLRAPTVYLAVLTSHGWSGGAVRGFQSMLEGTTIKLLDIVEVKGPPKKTEFDKLDELADKITEKLNSYPDYS